MINHLRLNDKHLKNYIVIALITLVVAVFLSHAPDGVFEHIKLVSRWLVGGEKPEVVTWPAWGYAFLIAIIPSFTIVILIQASIGVLSLAMLLNRLTNQTLKQKIILSLLFISAIPWYNQQVELYPSALAGSFTLLAILFLDTSIRLKSIKYAALAGVMSGFAQNFRTEFLLLPMFIGVCISVFHLIGTIRIRAFKSILIFIITALVFQLPWMFFYHSQTGRYSLTESSLGHVLYVSLGSVPGNKYGYIGNDADAAVPIQKAGFSYSSLSEEGNVFLKHLFIERVKENPWYMVQRTFQQLKNTVVAPFNWGEPRLDKVGQLHLDVLREEIKYQLGVGINAAELQKYQEQDLFSQAHKDKSAILALVYQIITNGAGCLIMLLGLAGMVVFLIRPSITPLTPLYSLLFVTALYKILQDILLLYQVNYLSNVYPMFLPFVVICLCSLKNCLQMVIGFARKVTFTSNRKRPKIST